jgi:predicted O-methyltransferase YrrM
LADATQFLTETHSVYDLIFLDADKRAYLNYFNLLISHTQIGSLILADNVLWGGKVLDLEKNQDRDTQAVHDFNIAVSEDVRFEKVILPIRDGLTLIQRVR